MKKIPLTQNKYALVDNADFEHLSQWKWFAAKSNNTYYAVRQIRLRNGNQAGIKMHRQILGMAKSKLRIDHIDLNGLNNQRLNLRNSSHGENMMNRRPHKNSSSKYLGVSFFKGKVTSMWRSDIQHNKIPKYLGLFKTEIQAAIAYDEAAKIYHGVFANLNFK